MVGPHSKSCLTSIWKNAGCTSEGRHQPKDYTDDKLAYLASFNIR